MALPLTGPGRSLRFALLPEGSDPDDLVRSGGRQALESILAHPWPVAELIWHRETAGKSFLTPERRAGLERRLYEIVRAIKDETLRRHYQSDFRARMFEFFRPHPQALGKAVSFGPTRERRPWQRTPRGAGPPPVSPGLAASPLLRPGSPTLPPREGLILLLLLNHPLLIGQNLEELADVEFSCPEAAALRDALLAYAADRPCGPVPSDSSSLARELRAALEAKSFRPLLQKLDAMAAHGSHWYVKAEAADADAGAVLRQALALHRRARALHRELQLAELALVRDSTEANLGRLKDIQTQLAALGGSEAEVEGFGVQSGRPSRTL